MKRSKDQNSNNLLYKVNKSFNYDHTKMHYKHNYPINAFDDKDNNDLNNNQTNKIFFINNETDLKLQNQFYAKLLSKPSNNRQLGNPATFSNFVDNISLETNNEDDVKNSSSSKFSTSEYLNDINLIIDKNISQHVNNNLVSSSVKKAESNIFNCYLLSCLNKKQKKILLVLFIILLLMVLLICIIVVCFYAFAPCLFNGCTLKYSECINYFFKRECKCLYGYNGDGYRFCDECGLSFNQPNLRFSADMNSSLRIIGGIQAIPNSWPSLVFISFKYKSPVYIANEKITLTIEVGLSCGGSLIDRRSVLTAAHCLPKTLPFTYKNIQYYMNIVPNSFYPNYESMLSVYLGVHNSNMLEETKRVSVSKLIQNPNFDHHTQLNDISILILSDQIDLNDEIQIACLPKNASKTYPNVNQSIIAVGWGSVVLGGPVSDTLNNVVLKVHDKNSCETQQFISYIKNFDSQICAGELHGSKDTFQGDSGSPVFLVDEVNNKKKFVVVGIVSYGYKCGLPNTLGIYSRVSYYLDWINSRKT